MAAPAVELVRPLRVAARESTRAAMPADRLVVRALAMLGRSPARPPSLSAVARRLGVDRSTLFRRFKAGLGQGPAEHLLAQRLRRAQDLLGGSDLPIAAVMARTGFTCRRSFNAVFRARCGATPTAFRAQARALPDGGRRPVPVAGPAGARVARRRRA